MRRQTSPQQPLSRIKTAILLTGIGLAFMSQAADAWPARILRVIDGDSFIAVDRNTGQRVTVDLMGAEAPVMSDGPGRPGQPVAQEATDSLRQLLSMGRVDVDEVGVASNGDSLAIVHSGPGDVGRIMVDAGVAWSCYECGATGRYVSNQNAARLDSRGVWAYQRPIPPWKWKALYWKNSAQKPR